MFEQWSFINKCDVDSESNPSEDELTTDQRKLKGVDRQKKSKKGKKKKPGIKNVNGPLGPIGALVDNSFNSHIGGQRRAGEAKILFNTS